MLNAVGGVIPRRQKTLGKPFVVEGFGLFHGLDVRIEVCPADEDHGVRFRRSDLSAAEDIPATLDYLWELPRRTGLKRGSATVETVEHLMAALAAYQVDNCLVRINAPEVPIADGSSLAFVEAIEQAGIVELSQWRPMLVVPETIVIADGAYVGAAAQPPLSDEYTVGYVLDYGPGPIPAQSLSLPVSPSSFRQELAFARTFGLESEVQQLRSAGLGLRATARDVVVFNDQGVIDNALRTPDECVRHKILDCIGDFALAGCDLHGRFTGLRSGHRHNHELIRQLLQVQSSMRPETANTRPSYSTFPGFPIASGRIAG